MPVELNRDEDRDRVAHLHVEFGHLNLLTPKNAAELRDAVRDVPSDVAVLTVGPPDATSAGLTAGLDRETVRAVGTSEARSMLRTLHGAMAAVRDSHAVTVCRCGEYALGGGLELAMSCDFRVILENGAVGLPEVDAGLVTGLQGGVLIRLVGLQAAKELVYTGEPISGTEAADIGLGNRAVPPEAHRDAVDDLVGTIAAKSPMVLGRQREVFRALRCTGVEAGIRHSLETIATCFDTHDQHEAMTAFLENREPRFEGR